MYFIKSPFQKYQIVESQLLKRNHTELNNLLEWLSETPKTTVYRINLLKSTRESFQNTLRNTGFSKNVPINTFTINGIDEMLCVSALQNDYLKVDKNLNEVIVDCRCGASLLRGAHLYAPGVLAMQSGTKLEESVNVFADLEGKCKKGTIIRYESEKKKFIGIGIVRMQRYKLFAENTSKSGVAVEMISTISGVPSVGDLSSSKALLQNFPSIVCTKVLDPKPGETILDMCSAPGNKTTHIAELMKDSGVIIALDKTESKIQLLKMKMKYFDLNCVHAFTFDSTKSLNEKMQNKNVLNGPPFSCNSFDKILLDAPCSALGNRPLLNSELSPKMLSSFPHVQKKLFFNAVGLLKVGGVLVYSTCTVTEAENEDIIEWAKFKFPQIKLIEAAPIYGGPGQKNCNFTEKERMFLQRFGPRTYNRDSTIDCVGFFIAKFIKIK